MSKKLTDKFSALTQGLVNAGSSWQTVNDSEGSFFSGVLFGSLIGLIWTPCAGPILAAVIVQVVLQQTTATSSLVILAFAIGAGLPMLLIALAGRGIMTRFQFFRTHTEGLRRILGLIIVLTVIYFSFFYDMNAAVEVEPTLTYPTKTLTQGLAQPYPAPAIAGIDRWINSGPLTWADLKNKVVLVDFWTYSCINCLRTLPYLKMWYAKYHDKGFEIIGVHSPEFAFEHNPENVMAAVKRFGITYPVALDNEFVTWRAFQNKYWPAHYLVDKNGQVVYEHFGEGEYGVTENSIRFLLGLTQMSAPTKIETTAAQTPETYLGYARAANFSSLESMLNNQITKYSFPPTLSLDHWALQGKWKIEAEKIVSSESNASLMIHFSAKNVYIVMGVSLTPVTVTLSLNGKPLSEKDSGHDVKNNQLYVVENRLYHVVNLPASAQGILVITASQPGLEVYTFTFG